MGSTMLHASCLSFVAVTGAAWALWLCVIARNITSALFNGTWAVHEKACLMVGRIWMSAPFNLQFSFMPITCE
jgi:hypothetical protein